MSAILDTIRNVIGSVGDAVLADTYTLTTDPQGTPVVYTCRGVPDDDVARHRDNGLTVEDVDNIVILFQIKCIGGASNRLTDAAGNQLTDAVGNALTDAAGADGVLTDISTGDYLTGPSDANNRASENMVVNDFMRDPANATWVIAAGT